MSEYHSHMENIGDMTGWSAMNEAPWYTPVQVMDYAGNLSNAVQKEKGWFIFSPYSGLMHGQPIRPIKWRRSS